MNFRQRLLRQRADHAEAAIPLTPMIDVVFLLIIFILFGDMGLCERQLVASLAPSGQALTPASSLATWLSIRLATDRAVEYRVNGGQWQAKTDDVSQSLSASLRAGRSDGGVVVDPREGVSLQVVIDAFVLCESAGARRMSLRTD